MRLCYKHFCKTLYFSILQDDETVGYVKVHAPWSVLADQAQLMNLKMPIAVGNICIITVLMFDNFK